MFIVASLPNLYDTKISIINQHYMLSSLITRLPSLSHQ